MPVPPSSYNQVFLDGAAGLPPTAVEDPDVVGIPDGEEVGNGRGIRQWTVSRRDEGQSV